MSTLNKFFDSVVRDAMEEFEYYRNGPIEMQKIQPGFIFQQCIDDVLAERGITAIESGLGDHCMPELEVGMQLKTTVQENPKNAFVFCRSSVVGKTPAKQRELRIKDVEERILEMYGQTGVRKLVLVYANLFNRTSVNYLLHKDKKFVGNWCKFGNVTTPFKQTHFMINKTFLVPLDS